MMTWSELKAAIDQELAELCPEGDPLVDWIDIRRHGEDRVEVMLDRAANTFTATN